MRHGWKIEHQISRKIEPKQMTWNVIANQMTKKNLFHQAFDGIKRPASQETLSAVAARDPVIYKDAAPCQQNKTHIALSMGGRRLRSMAS